MNAIANRKELILSFADAAKKLASYFSYYYQGYFSGDIEDIFFRVESDKVSTEGDITLRSFFYPKENKNDVFKFTWCIGPTIEVPPMLFYPFNGESVMDSLDTYLDALLFIKKNAQTWGEFFNIHSISDPITIIKFEKFDFASTYDLSASEESEMIHGFSNAEPFRIVCTLGDRHVLCDEPLPESIMNTTFVFNDRKFLLPHSGMCCILIASSTEGTIDLYTWHLKKKDSINDGFFIRGIRDTGFSLQGNVKPLYDFMNSTNTWALFGIMPEWGKVRIIGGYKQFIVGILRDYFIPAEIAKYLED